ncbi:hypothetical protein CDAR_298761 [Caerostris darwini]|uniref:Uncharacterized protein n=1 Tax=Caerostris darwini TaxID=1538125 RepID=A0AAV4T836_9ARAC|nr:hypothetical protein CDAR_222531 [Caerostris darwini]GIY42435.1 hypothetical protein CDAR_298761 [Caerostris darwini]
MDYYFLPFFHFQVIILNIQPAVKEDSSTIIPRVNFQQDMQEEVITLKRYQLNELCSGKISLKQRERNPQTIIKICYLI